MRQAQIQHVFGFILAAVIIISILALGSYFVVLLSQQGCAAEEHRLTNRLLEMSNTYDSYGTRQTVTLPAPCDAEKICFLDQDAAQTDASSIAGVTGGIQKQLALAAELPEPRTNIFLVREDALIELGRFEKVRVENKILCVDRSQGEFAVNVEGRGRSVTIKATE